MKKEQQITTRMGVEMYTNITLPSRYRTLINTFRLSSSNVTHYSENAPSPTNEKYLPEVSDMDNFLVFTGDQQPSVSNPAFREVLSEILSPEITLADLDFPHVDFNTIDVNSDEFKSLYDEFDIRRWNAMISDIPMDMDRSIQMDIGILIGSADTLNKIIFKFSGGRREDYWGYIDMEDYAKLFRKLLQTHQIKPEQIFFSTEIVSGWNSKDYKKSGMFYSDPEPINLIKSGEYPFYQLINIVHKLKNMGKNHSEIRTELFNQGYHVTNEELMEQLWTPAKGRLEMIHLTEFTDPTLLTMSDMIVNAETGLTLYGAIKKAKEIIESEDKFRWEIKELDSMMAIVTDWDSFVLSADRNTQLRLSASPNPAIREGAETAIMLAREVSKGEEWRIDASIANVQMSGFAKSLANETLDSSLDKNLLRVFSEIDIATKRDLLTKKSLNKIVDKLKDKYPELLASAFQSAVRSGIKISAEILREMDIEMPDTFFDDIRKDPNRLLALTKKLKDLMVKFHPDAQVRNADLYSDPQMKKLADEGHLALKNLYEWYDTVRKNYELIKE